jgi:tetratricopeptide (TPR) repeat protein
MVFLLTVFVFLPPDELIAAFGGAVSDQTGEGRWPIWKDTLRLIAAYPLFGCGMGGYFAGFLRYQTTGLANAWPEAHNDYLQLLSELGAVGFLIPATLMAAAFGHAVRAAAKAAYEVRMLGIACAGGLGAILIHSFADFNLYVPANAMALAWIAGVATALPVRARKEQPRKTAIESSFVRRFAVVCGCLASVYAAGWLVFTHSFRNDPKAEALFCRFGICDSDAALAAQESLHGGNSPGVAPPSELLAYLRRDPAGPYNWCDLGESFQKAGSIAEARACFDRAIALGPHIPFMLMRAGQFDLDAGDAREGVERMAQAIAGDASFAPTIFALYEQRKIAVEEVLAYGLPNRSAFEQYFRLQLEEGNLQSAAAAWNRMIEHRYVENKLAGEYVEFLVGKGKSEGAVEAWATYAGWRSRGYPESNRVFNGDFETDPSGCRFDWKIDPPRGAAVDFDRNAPYSGARSLRIQLDGKQNLSDAGVSQTVLLKPGRYRFRAYVRTEDLSTDEGFSFRVVEEESGKRVNFTTEGVLGSHDWTLVEHAFEAPSGVGLVRVGLVRKPSWRFDCLIRGAMWIDQVSIVPEEKAALAATGERGRE